MKVSAQKSTTTSSSHLHASNTGMFAKAGGTTFFAPQVQTKLVVNKPGDSFEGEADRMASKVMRMPAPSALTANGKVQRQPDDKRIQKKSPESNVQRASSIEVISMKKEDDKVQKKDTRKTGKKEKGAPSVGDATQSMIRSKASGGQPLSNDVRAFMESRFGADFSMVRIHADADAAILSNQLSARAFTYQNHIFFSRGQYRPGTTEGKELLAHELTHTIQQGHAVQRSPLVATTATPPRIQRFGMSDVLDYFADAAYHIPGFRLLTILMGVNPINMEKADRSAANIMRAMIELLPGGHLITQALDNHGVFEKAGAWVEKQLTTLGDIGGSISKGLDTFIHSLSWSDIFDLGGVWDRAKKIFSDPVVKLLVFCVTLVSGILDLVKQAILRPIAKLAEGTRGYDLLKAVLGKDPITGDVVPRNAETLIGGFMKLIGREDVWENIKKGNAIAKAWAWFQNALSSLMAFVVSIPGRIIDAFLSITLIDVITIVGVFIKIGKVFLSIATDFIKWAVAQILGLLEVIFTVVAPGAVPYIKKAAGAFDAVLNDPIGFVGNLVKAGRLGFQKFSNNITKHLQTALIKWITGPLGEAGIYMPKSFDPIEVIKLVLSVLGLTWQNIRVKLVKIIPEPALAGLEKSTPILVKLASEGPVAAWDQIKAELEELKGELIGQVTQMVTVEIVKAATIKLVSMLNPAGAIIQAIIAIYNTITFFIEKINDIASVVGSFLDSVADIAAAKVENAALNVEKTMANTLTLIIAFLAKFIGLGKIPKKIVDIIKKIRKPIDKGLDKIVAWLGKMLKKVGDAVKAGVKKLFQWWKKKVSIGGGKESHTLMFQGEGAAARLVVKSSPKDPEVFILEFNPTAENKAKIKEHKKAIALLTDKVAAAQAKNPPDEKAVKKADAKLTIAFNAFGKDLSDMIGGAGEEGSATKPIPIDYPKRRASAYRNIYIGPKTDHAVSQSWLQTAAGLAKDKAKDYLLKENPALGGDGGFESWSGNVTVFRAAGGSQAIDGGTVGLDPAFASLSPGKVFVYSKKTIREKGKNKINEVFRPFGFRPKAENLDGDHVMELQIGGPDILSNMWPLNSTDNRSSGATLKGLSVTFKDKSVKMHEVRSELERPLHLLVRSTR